MCNAYYHPPDCRCGFGGEGHLGGDYVQYGYGKADSRDFNLIHINSFLFDRNEKKNYFVKNSCCPVCGDEVYFYKSENGGRVFFDELGPPWPKHPCTDTSLGDVERFPLKNEERINFEFQKQIGTSNDYQKKKLEPISLKRINRFKNYSLFRAKEIIGFGRQIKFLLKDEYPFLETSLLFLKELNPIDFELHYFRIVKGGGTDEDSVKIYSLNSIGNDSNVEDTIRFSKVLFHLGNPDKEKVDNYLKKQLGIEINCFNTNKFRLPVVIYMFLLDEFHNNRFIFLD